MIDDRLHELAEDHKAAIRDAQMAEANVLEALHNEDFELAHDAVDQVKAACQQQAAIEDEVAELGVDRVELVG